MNEVTASGSPAESVTVQAGHGRLFRAMAGDEMEIINTSGTQVVDFWCVSPREATEYLSMEHCREVHEKIYFEPGDRLISNDYIPWIEYLADTSGGLHDTLIAACSAAMYRRFGRTSDHPSCAANFHAALADSGVSLPFTPQPWNLFMRAPVHVDGSIVLARPPYQPGGMITLRILADLLVVVSACPDDCYPTNGGDGSARDFQIRLTRAGGVSVDGCAGF